MIKSPRSVAAEQSREHVVLVDNLEQQKLDLEALRKEVSAAESVALEEETSKWKSVE